MNKQRTIKVFGLIGAIAAAVVAAATGDFVTAGGLIAAALSSASGIAPTK